VPEFNFKEQFQITSINDIEEISYDKETMKLNIPESIKDKIKIVGSTAIPVIDLKGNVHRPLQNKNVKITLELNKTTKEYNVYVKGKYEDEGENVKPKIIPELAEWYGLTGSMDINDKTIVLIKDTYFENVGQMFLRDMKHIGLNLSMGAKIGDNAIIFEYDDQSGYSKEGYGMIIKNNKIIIRAEHHVGAFYATRTLFQMLKNSDAHEIKNGYIRDYPKYQVRGFMLDVGRKFVKLDYIYEIMKTLSYYKMNDFQIHLNDNAIFLEHYNTTEEALNNAYTGFRLESDKKGNGFTLTSRDGSYTKDEFRQLIKDSSYYGVTIVPEFDTPGHALSFVKIRPDLMYQGEIKDGKVDQERAAMLNLSHEDTLPFIKSIYNEYLDGDSPVFSTTPIHIGSDEYYGDAEIYRNYVDDMLKFIRDDKKRTARLWGSLTKKRGRTAVTSSDVEMQIWNTDWAEPNEMISKGYNIINIEDEQVYIVPGADYYQDYLDTEKLYYNYEPNKFDNGAVINESHPQLLGGAFALWNDQIDTVENGITSYDMFDRIFSALPIIAQKNWAETTSLSYDSFQRLSEKVLYAPQTNPRFNASSKTNTILNYNFIEGKRDLSGNNYNLVNEEQVNINNGINFCGGESFVETPLFLIGPYSQLEIELKLNQTWTKQILMETDGYGVIYAVNGDGFIGYDFEGNSYAFNHKLEANRIVNLKFLSNLHKTRLFVDGKEVKLLDSSVKHYSTFVIPLQRIGGRKNSLDGKVTRLKLELNKEIEINQ